VKNNLPKVEILNELKKKISKDVVIDPILRTQPSFAAENESLSKHKRKRFKHNKRRSITTVCVGKRGTQDQKIKGNKN